MNKSQASRMVLAGGVVLLAVAGYGQLAGESPPGVRETFEAAAEAPGAGAATHVQPWRVALGAAGVSGEASFAGAGALRIEPGAPAGRVEFDIPGEVAGGAFFVEMQLLADAPVVRGVERPAVAVNGAQTGLVRVGADSFIQVFDAAAGAWKSTGTKWPGATGAGGGGAPAPWVKLTLRLDRAAGTWSLWVDGALAADGLPLDLAGAAPLTIFGAGDQAVFVDNLYVGGENPLLQDVFAGSEGTLTRDGKGDDEGAITDGTSAATNNKPAALDPDAPDADPDRDGLTNAQEEFFNTNKRRADHPAVGLVVFTPMQRSKEQLEAERQRALAKGETAAAAK